MRIGSTAKFLCATLALLTAETVISQGWTVYDMSNTPLPSTTVTAIIEDLEGGLWVGTDWGLCHFDGNDQWEVFQMDNSGLPWNSIASLALGVDGVLWVGTVAGGLVRYENGTWTVFDPDNSDFPSLGVRDLFVDHRGWVWATTASGLVCYTGDEWRIYDDGPSSYAGAILNTGNTNTVAVRGDGTVCLGTFNGGLHYITNDNVVTFLTTFQDGFFDNTATDALFDPVSGDRWVATPAAGMLRQQGPIVGGNWFQWNSSISFPSNAMECVTMDPQHRIWAGTQISGVLRIDIDGSFVQFIESNSGLPDNEVVSILAASDGSVWVGTVFGGLAQYRESVGLFDLGRVTTTKVFPNPISSDDLHVVLGGGLESGYWTLSEQQGKTVRSGQFNSSSFTISANGLVPGSYFLQMRGSSFVEAHRVLVF